MSTSTVTLTKRSTTSNNSNNSSNYGFINPEISAKISGTAAAESNSVNNNTRVDGKNFTWSATDEPHATRRRLILESHPEIRDLFGPEPLTLPIVMLIISIQVSVAYYLRNSSWGILLLCAWIIGGTLNHSLQLAVHELSHNLAFNNQTFNKLLSICGNLTTGFPSAITFQKYHMDHHQFQGVDGIDTDIPTTWEVNNFTNTVLKMFWIFCQPLFYAFRPVLVKPKPVGKWELINWIFCMSFNFAIYYFLGIKSLCYLISGTLLGLGFHPAAGHFIAEHYEFIKGIETYSYYGFWNYFNFNVGYHNEHHDFPKIAWSRLPLVKQIAPEFYDNLPSYTSYCWVFYKYITDPEVGPFSRVKRIAAINTSKSDSDDNTTSNKKPVSRVFSIVAVGGMAAAILTIIASVIYY